MCPSSGARVARAADFAVAKTTELKKTKGREGNERWMERARRMRTRVEGMKVPEGLMCT